MSPKAQSLYAYTTSCAVRWAMLGLPLIRGYLMSVVRKTWPLASGAIFFAKGWGTDCALRATKGGLALRDLASPGQWRTDMSEVGKVWIGAVLLVVSVAFVLWVEWYMVMGTGKISPIVSGGEYQATKPARSTRRL